MIKKTQPRPGTVILTQPYRKPNGDILPIGTKICFDLPIARKLIDKGLATPFTGTVRHAAMDSEHGIRSKGKVKRAKKKEVKK
jgi:hypothetical protein